MDGQPHPVTAQSLRESFGGTRLAVGQGESKPQGRLCHPLVVACKQDDQPLTAQKVHRRQMQRVERAHGLGKGQQRTAENLLRQLEQADPIDEPARRATVRCRGAVGMDSIEDFNFEQTAGYERLRPECIGRETILGKELRENDRAIQIDQRSARLASSSRKSRPSFIVGRRGGSRERGPDLAGAKRP